jgi:hypothetical protein
MESIWLIREIWRKLCKPAHFSSSAWHRFFWPTTHPANFLLQRTRARSRPRHPVARPRQFPLHKITTQPSVSDRPQFRHRPPYPPPHPLDAAKSSLLSPLCAHCSIVARLCSSPDRRCRRQRPPPQADPTTAPCALRSSTEQGPSSSHWPP